MKEIKDEELLYLMGENTGDYHYRTKKEIEAIAAEKNCRAVFAKPNQLFVDIDSPHQLKVFKDNWPRFQELYGGWVSYYKPSKSGGMRRHIIIDLPFAPEPFIRVFMQRLLGSDHKRDMQCLFEIASEAEVSVCFFEPITKEE